MTNQVSEPPVPKVPGFWHLCWIFSCSPSRCTNSFRRWGQTRKSHCARCVWLRHAKAGELCERFPELHLISGDRIVTTVPTYRGEGHTFL